MSRKMICAECGRIRSHEEIGTWREIWDKTQRKNLKLCGQCHIQVYLRMFPEYAMPQTALLDVPGTPQELRAQADGLYQSAIRADRMSQREMDSIEALRNEADRRESERH